MTADEWLEIVGWVNTRFSPGWSLDRAAAYGVDLKAYHAEDVWDALLMLNDTGLEFPPTGSVLKKSTIEAIQRRMYRAQLEARGLPENAGEDASWDTWKHRLGYDGTLAEAIAGSHGRQFPKGCVHPFCDVCGNHVEAGSEILDIPSQPVT